MLTRPFLAGLILLLLISIVLRSPLLFLLAVLLAFVGAASLLWDRYCLSNVSYSRRFGAERLFAGEATDLWLEITNAKPLPLAWLKVQDEFSDAIIIDKAALSPAGETHRLLLTNLFAPRWYERVRRHYHLATTRRGVFEFGPVALTSGDIFGFQTRRSELDERASLTVYPKLVPLEALDLKPAHPLGDESTRLRTLPDPFRLAGARDYAAGDPLRHIHWKATARRGSLQTKHFDPSASRECMIFLNLQSTEHAYGVQTDALETAIVAAAALSHAALDAHVPVGLVSNGALRGVHGLARLPASRHSSQEVHLLELLARITYFTSLHFELLLRAEAPRLPYGASLMVVTTVITEGLAVELLNLRQSGHPVAVIQVGQQSSQAVAGLPVYHLARNWTELETIKLD